MFADVCGLLLGGPAVVGSLFDVIGRSPPDRADLRSRRAPPDALPARLHQHRAAAPDGLRRRGRGLPAAVDPALPGRPGREHPAGAAGQPSGGESRSWSTRSASGRSRRWAASRCARSCPYARKEQQIVEEAAGRLAAGTDPGIIPERLVIGAARVALDRRLARPGRDHPQLLHRPGEELSRDDDVRRGRPPVARRPPAPRRRPGAAAARGRGPARTPGRDAEQAGRERRDGQSTLAGWVEETLDAAAQAVAASDHPGDPARLRHALGVCAKGAERVAAQLTDELSCSRRLDELSEFAHGGREQRAWVARDQGRGRPRQPRAPGRCRSPWPTAGGSWPSGARCPARPARHHTARRS